MNFTVEFLRIEAVQAKLKNSVMIPSNDLQLCFIHYTVRISAYEY